MNQRLCSYVSDRYDVIIQVYNLCLLKNVKISELKNLLETLPNTDDLNVVTGDEWLPEQLISTSVVDDMLFLEFDNAPDEIQGEEARGFVEHEIDVIRNTLTRIMLAEIEDNDKIDALLNLFLLGHELGSCEFIEALDESEQLTIAEEEKQYQSDVKIQDSEPLSLT